MKYNIRYICYMIIVCAVMPLQEMLTEQARIRSTREYDLAGYALAGNLCLLAFGILLALDKYIAQKADAKIRTAVRLIVSAVLLAEMFKLPLMSDLSLLNEWGLVLPAAAVTAGYMLITAVVDLVIAKKKALPTVD